MRIPRLGFRPRRPFAPVQILLPDMFYKMFLRRNSTMLNRIRAMPPKAPDPIFGKEMRFLTGLTNVENAHITRNNIPLELYLKERKDKHGY